MYGQHAPQTQNDRTSSFIRSVKRHAGVRVVAFGAIILVSGQLLLPGSAQAAETPEPDAATPITRSEANTDGNFTAATVVDHNYDLELPPAFMLVQNEAFVYDFPDKPEDFIYRLNDTIHLFKVDTDTESLIKTENPKEASVSITLTMIDNHVRATVVFTGSYADDQIPYRLNLNSSTHLGTHVDRDFDSGQGIMHETRHDYYIRYVFDSDVHLIATDTSGSKPEPETKPEPTPQPEAKKPTANPVSTKAVAAVKPTGTTLPATGDNGAMAAALSVAGGVVAAVGISATRRRNR
jgi:LPXTG-motif cell wall-anchored protein